MRSEKKIRKEIKLLEERRKRAKDDAAGSYTEDIYTAFINALKFTVGDREDVRLENYTPFWASNNNQGSPGKP